MGKGGYNGGSTVVGFSGSGWVGRGSVTMRSATKKNGSATPSKKKTARVRPSAIPAALADDEELQRLSRRVKAIEADINAAQRRMSVLTRQLQLATNQLKTEIITKTPKPVSKARRKP